MPRPLIVTLFLLSLTTAIVIRLKVPYFFDSDPPFAVWLRAHILVLSPAALILLSVAQLTAFSFTATLTSFAGAFLAATNLIGPPWPYHSDVIFLSLVSPFAGSSPRVVRFVTGTVVPAFGVAISTLGVLVARSSLR